MRATRKAAIWPYLLALVATNRKTRVTGIMSKAFTKDDSEPQNAALLTDALERHRIAELGGGDYEKGKAYLENQARAKGGMATTQEQVPAHLLALFESVRPPAVKGVQYSDMSGYPCCLVNGDVFMVLRPDRLVLRLSPEDRESFLKLSGTGQVDGTRGRRMSDYVTVPGAMLTDRAKLRTWIKRSLRYVRALSSG